MFLSDKWKDYELLDASDGEKAGALGEMLFCSDPTLK